MIEVLHPGFFSSIQDLGRYGYRSYGVPTSGALDVIAIKQANMLLQNNDTAAVIEMTLIGAKLKFNCATSICITGANMQPKLNGKPIPNYKIINVEKEDELYFGKVVTGVRCYLAISGGINVKNVLKSKSFYSTITPEYKLEAGHELPIQENINKLKKIKNYVSLANNYLRANVLEVFKGPEYNLLTNSQKEFLETNEFTITANNRMAYFLKEELHNTLSGIITSSVFPGTIQLTPSGKLIVLMNDCQTTGGYPRVLQLTQHAIAVLSQKKQNQSINFKIIN